MKIDAHQHFWIYDQNEYGWIGDKMTILKHDFLPDHLESLIVPLEFGGSIAVQARQTLSETEWLLKLADEHDYIKGVVGWLDIQSPQFKHQLEKYARRPKLVGIRHVVQDEPDDRFMLRSEFIEGIRELENYNLVFEILIYERQLPSAIELVSRFPHHRFVLDHLGKPQISTNLFDPWKSLITELAEFPNVDCKLSGMVTEADWKTWKKEDLIPYMDVVIDAFGTDRVIYGSDWPVCLLAATYQDVNDLVSDYIRQFHISEQVQIMGENAIRVYGL